MNGILSSDQAERLNAVIDPSNLEDLTPETLLEAFKAEGIRSLEDLAKQMAEALRDPAGRPERRLDYSTLFSEPTPPEILETIVHPVPKVPFVVDGVTHDPKDISRYNGKELAFLPQEGGKELLVMTDKTTWAPFVRTLLVSRQFLSGRSPMEGYQYGGYGWVNPQNGPIVIVGQPPGSFGPPVPPPAPPELTLWTDVNLGGEALTVYSGESRRDLRRVGWWIFARDFNDKFSSVGRTSSLCVAFEHINFMGSVRMLGPSATNTLDLGDFGDRISSVINGG